MQERGKTKYHIGEVAKICGLSVKALRYYDTRGILVPSQRDERNNYRYYSEDQLLEALAIREMKLRGFTLEELQEFSNSRSLNKIPESLNKKLRSLTEEIEHLERQKLLVKNSQDILMQIMPDITQYNAQNDTPSDKTRKIMVSTFCKQHCVYTRYRSRIFVQEIFWDRFADIYQLLDAKGYIVSGPIMAVFHEHYTHQFFFEEGDLEVLQPISNPDLNDKNIKEFGGFQVASLIYVGFYANLLPEYVALIKWIEANDYYITGDPIEEYLVEFTQGVDREKYVTRISFPVEKGKG